jgi:2-methylcitrate dehydratase PrpD
MVHASGRDLIAAVIAGYEVSLRIGRAIRSMVIEDGIRRVLFSSSFTVFGAAASAGRLFRLDRITMAGAFGLAGTYAPGSPQGVWEGGTPAKLGESKFAYQIHTLRGILAAWQAKQGIDGPLTVLDGDIFWTCGGAGTCDFARLTEGLGEKYWITEIGFKPEPSCRLTHHSTEAVRQALAGRTVKPDDIEKITLHQAVLLPPTYDWTTMVEAQFSPPCAVALSLNGGEPFSSWYPAGRFNDPDVKKLAQRIEFVEDNQAADLWLKYGALVCRAEVKLKNGEICQGLADAPKGEPGNPMTTVEIERKFMDNARLILDERRTDEIRDQLLRLEEVENVSALADLLHP